MRLTNQEMESVAERIPSLLAEWRERDSRIHGIGIGRIGRDASDAVIAFLADETEEGVVQIPATIPFTFAAGERVEIETQLVKSAVPMFCYCVHERPALGGNCISSLGSGTVGTLGGVVVDPDSKTHYVVSAAHVLTNKGYLPLGTDVLQPNDASKVIGKLSHLGPRWPLQSGTMKADASLAKVNAADVSYDIFKIGTIAGTVTPAFGMAIKARGAATNAVQSEKIELTHISETIESLYTFTNLVATPRSSRQGDSGALAIEASSLKVAGLLFAHNDKYTYYATVDDVISVLEIENWYWGKPPSS